MISAVMLAKMASRSHPLNCSPNDSLAKKLELATCKKSGIWSVSMPSKGSRESTSRFTSTIPFGVEVEEMDEEESGPWRPGVAGKAPLGTEDKSEGQLGLMSTLMWFLKSTLQEEGEEEVARKPLASGVAAGDDEALVCVFGVSFGNLLAFGPWPSTSTEPDGPLATPLCPLVAFAAAELAPRLLARPPPPDFVDLALLPLVAFELLINC